MTATLPQDVQQVFERFITTEYTTVDAHGPADHLAGHALLPRRRTARSTSRPGSAIRRRPTTPRATRRSSLLFSDPTGSGIDAPCAVLVQGTAQVDDSDLDANRERYCARERREAAGDQGACIRQAVPARACSTGTTRGSTSTCARSACSSGTTATSPRSPTLYGARVEEVRSHHSAEPRGRRRRRRRAARPNGTTRMDELGRRHQTPCCRSSAPTASRCRCRARRSSPTGPRSRVRLGELPDWLPAAPEQGLPDRARARPELRVADELPGPRRPRAGRRRLVARAAPAGGRLRAAEEQARRPTARTSARCCASARRRSASWRSASRRRY